jgi:hypothetical protein
MRFIHAFVRSTLKPNRVVSPLGPGLGKPRGSRSAVPSPAWSFVSRGRKKTPVPIVDRTRGFGFDSGSITRRREVTIEGRRAIGALRGEPTEDQSSAPSSLPGRWIFHFIRLRIAHPSLPSQSPTSPKPGIRRVRAIALSRFNSRCQGYEVDPSGTKYWVPVLNSRISLTSCRKSLSLVTKSMFVVEITSSVVSS